MTARVDVDAFLLEAERGLPVFTIGLRRRDTRAPREWEPPAASDVPADVRAALLEWLGPSAGPDARTLLTGGALRDLATVLRGAAEAVRTQDSVRAGDVLDRLADDLELSRALLYRAGSL